MYVTRDVLVVCVCVCVCACVRVSHSHSNFRVIDSTYSDLPPTNSKKKLHLPSSNWYKFKNCRRPNSKFLNLYWHIFGNSFGNFLREAKVSGHDTKKLNVSDFVPGRHAPQLSTCPHPADRNAQKSAPCLKKRTS